jgi:hypothetical protein
MEEIEYIEDKVIEHIHKAFELWQQCPVLGYSRFNEVARPNRQMDEFCYFARDILAMKKIPKRYITSEEPVSVEKCPRRIP